MICTQDVFAWALAGSTPGNQGPELSLCTARAEDGIGL